MSLGKPPLDRGRGWASETWVGLPVLVLMPVGSEAAGKAPRGTGNADGEGIPPRAAREATSGTGVSADASCKWSFLRTKHKGERKPLPDASGDGRDAHHVASSVPQFSHLQHGQQGKVPALLPKYPWLLLGALRPREAQAHGCRQMPASAGSQLESNWPVPG